MHEDRAKRFDVLDAQQRAKVENWPDGTVRTLTFRAPHTDAVVSTEVELSFTAERYGGRRIWFCCPVCGRRVRFLFGGKPRANGVSDPYRIACARCQRIAYASNLEGEARRWRRQLAKLERRLGGDPRKITPPKGTARRTFDRLAARHERYRQRIVAQSQANYRHVCGRA